MFNNFYGESATFINIPKETTIKELKGKISKRLQGNLKDILERDEKTAAQQDVSNMTDEEKKV